MSSTTVCLPKTSRDLSLPMRRDSPPTRMKASTSNIAQHAITFLKLGLYWHQGEPTPDQNSGSVFLKDMESIKRNNTLLIVAAIVLSTAAINTFGQGPVVKTATRASASSASLFPLEDLRPGMKGIARSVFSVSETQEFGVEILGVLAGFTGPRQSTIIGKLSGTNVDRTGVFAGMSGSPVFIDDRLVGAIAYSFPFAKEPICGITPIKQMIDIFEGGSDKPKGNGEPRAISFAKLASAEWQPALPRQSVGARALIAPVAAGSPLESRLCQQMKRTPTP